MSNKNVKHPCIGCVYFVACGKPGRTEFCAGRTTKTDRKNEQKREARGYDGGNVSKNLCR